MGIIIVQDTLPGFPHTPFRPVGERFPLWGGRLRVSRRQKPPGYPFLHRFSGPFRRRGDFCVKYDNKM
jgi:hypothetical protein